MNKKYCDWNYLSREWWSIIFSWKYSPQLSAHLFHWDFHWSNHLLNFSFDMVWSCCISFPFRKQEKFKLDLNLDLVGMKCTTFAQSCFIKNYWELSSRHHHFIISSSAVHVLITKIERFILDTFWSRLIKCLYTFEFYPFIAITLSFSQTQSGC